MIKCAPVILQLSDTECGIASLAMIFAYYKLNVPLEVLRDQCAVARDGCKAQTLINAANYYGFKAEAYQVTLDALSELTSPVIAHWKFSHYIVINRVRRDKVHFNDPAFGAMTLPLAEFSRYFTGVIINIAPHKKIQTRNVSTNHTNIAHQYFDGHYTDVLFITLCLLVSSICPYLLISAYKIVVDHCIILESTILLPILTIACTLIYTVYLVTSYLHKIAQSLLITKLGISYTNKLVEHLFQLPHIFYSLRRRSEIFALTLRTESSVNILLKTITNGAVSMISASLCLIVLAIINYRLAAHILIINCLYFSISLSLKRLASSHEKLNTIDNAKLNLHTLTAIKNLETIHASSLQNNILKKYDHSFTKHLNSKNRIDSIKITQSTLIKLYNAASIFAIILIGSNKISSLIISYGLCLILFHFISQLINEFNDSHHHLAHRQRINDVTSYEIDRRHDISDMNSNFTDSTDIVIRCSNLGFYYNPNEKPNLKDISFTIYKNQHIAFIGHTGSGKSTLAKLLCALYQPSAGFIEIFGENISNLSANNLARAISYVSQESTLFSDTLLNNLTLYKMSSLDDIYTAIKATCLEEFVAERGLHTIIEEGGRNLSGGEKQRIDIARALLQNTPILILDEATSALDEQTETRLISNLAQTNKTIIYIAHRPSTINHCDRIFTLQHGEIIKHEDHTLQK